jgi:hypothetical protein
MLRWGFNLFDKIGISKIFIIIEMHFSKNNSQMFRLSSVLQRSLLHTSVRSYAPKELKFGLDARALLIQGASKVGEVTC